VNRQYTKLWLLAFPLINTLVWGQSFTGSISGIVTDPTGAAIPSSNLTLKFVETGTVTKFTTGLDGHYLFGNLKQGTYDLTVAAAGFRQYTQNGITININQSATQNIKLEIGGTEQAIEVTANASALNFQNAEIKQAIPDQAVYDLPLQVSGNVRTAASFALLMPGVNAGASNDVSVVRVNGGQLLTDEALIDGVTTTEGTSSVAGMVTLYIDAPPIPDEVSEVSVLTSNYEPQYGATHSSVISMVTRSGANKFHGSLFEHFKNTKLNARQFGVALRPEDKENEIGGSIGGPVKLPGLYTEKRKTFFFYLYDRWIPRGGATNPVLSVPTVQERQGDFSDWKDATGKLIPVYDPATTRANPNYDAGQPVGATNQPFLRDQFMGCDGAHPNVICSTDPRLVNSLANAWFKFLPVPNRPGLTSNYVGPATSAVAGTDHRTTEVLKIDHYEGEKDHWAASIHYRFKQAYAYTQLPAQISAQALQLDAGSIGPWQNRMLWDHTFSPTLLNNVNFGYNNYRGGSECIDQPYVDQFPKIAGAYSYYNPPVISFTNFNSMGCNNIGVGNNRRVYVVNDLGTWVKGSHTFKFGGEYRAIQANGTTINNGSGTFTFQPLTTGLSGINSGNDIASFILGMPGVASLTWTANTAVESRQKYYALYAGDTFKVTRKLTLNYGLRWDLSPPIFEKYGRTAFLDPYSPNPGAGNRLGVLAYPSNNATAPSFSMVAPETTYYRAFAPRLAVAYGVSDKTVVRSGYGIFFTQAQYPGWSNGNSQDGYVSTPTFSSSNGGITPPFLLSQGIPQNFVKPPALTGTFDNGQAGPVYRAFDANRLPYAQQWNLTIEHQFTNNLYMSTAYVGNKGTRLVDGNLPANALDTSYLATLGQKLFDQFTPTQTTLDGVSIPYAGWVQQMAACAPTVAQALRPFPQYCGPLRGLNQNDGNSTFHSFQVKVEKRLSHGTWLLSSYTLSKLLSSADSAQTTAISTFVNAISPYERHRQKSLSDSDTPNNFSFGVMVTLPFGKGQKFLNQSGPLDRVVGNWQLTSIYRAASGTPLLFRSSQCNVPAQFAAQCIPGILSGANPFLQDVSSYDPGKGPLLNKAAFESPNSFNSYLGNGARVSNLRGQGFANHDLTLSKGMHIREQAELQIRIEAFNLWNWHFFTSGGTINGSPGAVINNVALPTFGTWNGNVTSPRVVQLSARFQF
jgi:hypothetical protein